MRILKDRKIYVEVVGEQLARDGVQIRIIHASPPSRNFEQSLEGQRDLMPAMEMVICPRVHFKAVIVDGLWAFTGSANFTGAGMGVKSERRRNFELGMLFDEPRRSPKSWNTSTASGSAPIAPVAASATSAPNPSCNERKFRAP
jgi:phosphatidylserine/phosphatidylglycerophosphate/cardiolipin synthase-like enzyme